MGMTTNSNASANRKVLLNFVPLLGGLYVVNDANTAAIKEAREHAGAKQTDGYTTGPDSVSAKALAYLREKGIESVRLSGKLVSISHDQSKVPANGNVIEKALIVISDKAENGVDDEEFLLSLNLSNVATQKLVRKLENVPAGSDLSVVNLFGTYTKNEDPESPSHGRFFTEYGAEVKDGDGNEIKASPEHVDALKLSTEDVRANLAAAKITDKTVINTAVSNARTEYHVKLTKQIQQKFGDKYAHEAAQVATGVPAEDDTPQIDPDEMTFGQP